MGEAYQWLFPALSFSDDNVRSKGYTVSKGGISTSSKPTGNSKRGYFSWSNTLKSSGNGIAMIHDTREFETEDGATRKLAGKGKIKFSERRGVIYREFGGSFKERDKTYKIALQITQLTPNQLQKLLPAQSLTKK